MPCHRRLNFGALMHGNPRNTDPGSAASRASATLFGYKPQLPGQATRRASIKKPPIDASVGLSRPNRLGKYRQ